MRAQLSNRDYEQLSAYIDGQLAPAERRKLEEHLHARPELQMALDEISRTRALLRSAPRRRAPRNFTLTEAMVGERGSGKRGMWWNIFPVLSFTSALATLALVASFLFQALPTPAVTQAPVVSEPQAAQIDHIVQATMTVMMATASAKKPAAPNQKRAASGAESATSAAAAQPTEPASLAAPMAAAQPTATQPLTASGQAQTLAGTPTAQAQLSEGTAQPELAQPKVGANQESTPPIVTWGANGGQPGATGMGGGGGQGPGLGNILGPPPAPATAAPALGMGGGAGGAAPAGQGGTIVLPTESLNSLAAPTNPADATQPAEPTAAPAQPNPAISGTGPILGVPAPGQGGQITDQKAILGQPAGQRSQPAPAGAQQPATAPSGQTLLGLPVLVVLQGLLALLAIATGIGAFIIYRRAR